MIVVDTSAIVDVLVSSEPDPELRSLVSQGDVHAPHLLDVEVVSALRRHVARGTLSADRAADARKDFEALTIVRYPHVPLLDRIWELRENLTAYDAAYVALSELLGAPLVTCDASLARAPGHEAEVKVFA